MSVAFVKKPGAPAGTINFSIGGTSYTIDDGLNSSITATASDDIKVLMQSPYLNMQGGSSVYTPQRYSQQVIVNTDGTEAAGTVPVKQSDGSFKLDNVVGGSSSSSSVGSGLYALTQRASTRAIFSAQDRCAIYDAVTGNVVVCYLGDQRWLIAQTFNATTKKRSEPVYISPPRASLGFEDNHGVASMAMDANGYYHVIWGAHNLVPIYSRSVSPHDISAWITPLALTVGAGTYHSMACDRTTNTLFVTYRAFSGSGDGHGSTYPAHEFAGLLTAPVASDGTPTWTETAGGIISTVPYSAEAKKDAYVGGCDIVNGKLHISMQVAHGPVHDSQRADVFHFVYDPSNGHIYNLAGVDQGPIVNTLPELTACRVTSAQFTAGIKHVFKSDGTGIVCWNQLDSGSTLAQDLAVGGTVADLNTHTADTGQTWSRQSINDGTSIVIDATNGIYTTSTVGIAAYVLNYTPSSADYAMEVDINVKSVIAGAFYAFEIRTQADGSAYIATVDGVNLSLQYRNPGGATVWTIASPCVLTAGTTGTLRIEARGSAIWSRVSMSDGTFASARNRDTNITAVGKPGMRLRQGSTTTGVHVTAVRTMSKSAIRTWVGHWNGTDWQAQDTGHATNHAYYQPCVRLTESGGYELFTVVGRTEDVVTTRPQETWLPYLDAGADIGMLTSSNGRTWTDKGVIIPRTMARGQWWQGGQVPLDAPRQAKLLCLPSGIGYGTLDGYPTADLGLYLWSDEDLDALAVARYWVQPGPVVQRTDPLFVFTNISPASNNTWTALDVTTYVPPNCTRAYIRFYGIGNGTANTQSYIAVREFGTARSEDASTIGNAGDTFTSSTNGYGWVPIGRNRTMEYRSANLAASSLSLALIAFE